MMPPEQPLQPEGAYLLYLLKVGEDGVLPPVRLLAVRGEQWTLSWLARQERASLYALGRIRESIVHRVKRLHPERQSDEARFLMRLLAQCQDDDGGRVVAPRWPASKLGTVAGMIRARMLALDTAA
jgi:hypothetical protein